MIRVAVLGSAFGPPTLGHLDTLEQFKDKADQFLLVPAYAHGFGKQMIDFSERLTLAHQFASDARSMLDMPVIATSIEEELYDDGPVYTYSLLKALDENYQEAREDVIISFIMGPDNWDSFHKFYKYREIIDEFQVLVAEERKAIRSTLVRKLIDDQDWDAVAELTTPSVLERIKSRNLFKNT